MVVQPGGDHIQRIDDHGHDEAGHDGTDQVGLPGPVFNTRVPGYQIVDVTGKNIQIIQPINKILTLSWQGGAIGWPPQLL